MILLRLISWPYARKHLLRSLLTTAGIVLGVAVFVGMHTANQTVLAAFRQTTSRADDPQLHTHVVISAKVRSVFLTLSRLSAIRQPAFTRSGLDFVGRGIAAFKPSNACLGFSCCRTQGEVCVLDISSA
jgi:hypothetical protein